MQIYIHIPFCESKCPYCAFGSFANKSNLIQPYFVALKNDILHNFINLDLKDKQISSIFIGGGTPSCVETKFYAPIFEILSPFLDKSAEITTEANPNSANLKWLSQMRKFGVNRISFGAQSFDEKKLKFLGRIHDKKAIFQAVLDAKTAGFSNINIDLIYGSKFDNKKLLLSECENIAKLGIEHISAYALSIENNTKFALKPHYAKQSPNLAKFLFKNLSNLGFLQYEISNFAKNNKICKHNLGYWQKNDYLGFGAYSVGSVGNARFSALNLKQYLSNPLFRNIENLSSNQIKMEKIFLGLRSNVGVELEIFNKFELEKIQILKNAKKIYIKNDKIFNKNFLLADEICLYLT